MPRLLLTTEVVLSIARLRSDGYTESEIASRLDLSQSTVSRGVRAAISQGILKTASAVKLIAPRADSECSPVDPSRKDGEFAHRVSQWASPRGSRWALSALVIPVGNVRGVEAKLSRLANRCARHVGGLLAGSKVCGVSWGVTLKHVVGALEALTLPVGRRSTGDGVARQVIPLCGEPLGSGRVTSESSSVLAERLDAALYGPRSRALGSLSLGLVPAFLPPEPDFTAADVESAWKLIGYSEGYKCIFGQPSAATHRAGVGGSVRQMPLVSRLDAVLTSASVDGNSFGDLRKSALIDARLEPLLVGDIGGVPLPRADLSTVEAKRFERICERWTGLRREHLAHCAGQASAAGRSEERTGVILVALGAEKARCVLAAVRARLVNHLVVDESLMKAMDDVMVRRSHW